MYIRCGDYAVLYRRSIKSDIDGVDGNEFNEPYLIGRLLIPTVITDSSRYSKLCLSNLFTLNRVGLDDREKNK